MNGHNARVHKSRVLALGLVWLALAACVTSARVAQREPAPSAARVAPIATNAAAIPAEPLGPELPRGGRSLFPHYRLVGFCGTPGAPNLGELTGDIRARAKELTKLVGDLYATPKELLKEAKAVVAKGAR